MHKLVVINAVALTPSLISPEQTPRLHAFRAAGAAATIAAVLPAVTTTVQSTYLTGQWPAQHGIVANGCYFRDTAEIRFWLQSNTLVQGEKVWDRARKLDPAFTVANLFWWYNMYATVDYAVTPRPMYPADGRKIPDVHTFPQNLRTHLQQKLGQFPLFNFWGPATDVKATTWIADASIEVDRLHNPTLTLIYLPHLDYVLQKEGPAGPTVPAHLRQLDNECGKLIDHYQSRGARVIILSEYGITPVSRPVHLNRALRDAGLLTIREELGRELLDAGASQAFAVADHQLAHVYVKDPVRIPEIKRLLQSIPGVASVLTADEQESISLNHPRAGELVCLAEPNAWFTYYFWHDDNKAPDYARTVDIHRKPGYDPAELFLDPTLTAPKLKIALTLAKKKLGLRTLMQVIPLDATMVKGSHGLAPTNPNQGPLFLTTEKPLLPSNHLLPTDIANQILSHLQTP